MTRPTMQPVRAGCGAFLLALFCGGTAAAQEEAGQAAYCQILDNVAGPLYEAGLTYVADSDFEDYGGSSMVELDGDWDFAYYRNVLRGDIDLSLRFRTILFVDSAGLELPDQVLRLSCDAGWTWRYANGNAFQLRLEPGLYSDVEEIDGDAFAMPVSLALVRNFGSRLSSIGGVQIRIGFEREIMPIVGLAWEASNAVRVEAGLPESRLTWFVNRDWSAHLGLDWENTSYNLREKGMFGRDGITIEDLRVFAGLAHRISDRTQLSAEIGRALSRSVEFEYGAEGQDSVIDIDEALFVRFALGGYF